MPSACSSTNSLGSGESGPEPAPLPLTPPRSTRKAMPKRSPVDPLATSPPRHTHPSPHPTAFTAPRSARYSKTPRNVWPQGVRFSASGRASRTLFGPRAVTKSVDRLVATDPARPTATAAVASIPDQSALRAMLVRGLRRDRARRIAPRGQLEHYLLAAGNRRIRRGVPPIEHLSERRHRHL